MIEIQNSKIAIFGLGYVGLPIFESVLGFCNHVSGYDTSLKKIELLQNNSLDYLDYDTANLKELIGIKKPSLHTEFDSSNQYDIYVVALPTPLNVNENDIEIENITNLLKKICQSCPNDSTIILESTVYPGFTNEHICDYFKSIRPKDRLHVVFSPERIDPGNKKFQLKNIPKIVSGSCEQSLQIGMYFYSQIVDKCVPAPDIKTAEYAKLNENIYRAVNIAYANESNEICKSLDIKYSDVLKLCSSKPFGYTPFFSSAGVGGHCIPVDPAYLLHVIKDKIPTSLVTTAFNDNLKRSTVIGKQCRNIIQKYNCKKILIVGYSYKKNSSDARHNPVEGLINAIQSSNVELTIYDPVVKTSADSKIPNITNDISDLQDIDLSIIVTVHDAICLDKVISLSKHIIVTRSDVFIDHHNVTYL